MIYLTIIAAVIVSAFLIYNEMYTSLTNVAVLITAITSLFTILEMRKQRTLSVRPNLIFEEKVVPIEITKNFDPPPPTGQFILVKNIGLGSAINIIYEWEGQDEIISQINALTAVKQINLSIKKNKRIINVEGKRPALYTSWKSKLDVPFLKEDGLNEGKIYMDPTVNFYAMYIELVKDRIGELKELPITLSLEYEDIYGKKYKVKKRFVYTIHQFHVDASQYDVVLTPGVEINQYESKGKIEKLKQKIIKG